MKRKSNQGKSTDFKRLKAKVGKRAPKALNATDTSFQTSALHVQKQTVDPSEAHRKKVGVATSIEDLQLISSRGKLLSSLLIQLNHPSPSMRSSSLQGIQDAIVTCSSIAVKTNLSLLIPTLSKCFVDEDTTVRTLAISCLRHIYKIVCSSSSSTHIEGSSTMIMRPFLPLHSAYLSSALNSLDEAIRMDGVKVAEMTFAFVPIFMKEKVSTLLPSYVRLLAQLSTSSSSVSSTTSNKNILIQKKKKKQKKGSTASGDHHRKAVIQLSNKDQNRCLILKSLFSLLRAHASEGIYHDEEDTSSIDFNESTSSIRRFYDSYRPNLTFLPGGAASNAILLPRSFTSQQRLPSITSYLDFPSIFSNTNDNKASDKSQQNTKQSKLKLKPNLVERTDLLYQLRDCWIEVTQHGEEINSKGISMHEAYLEQALLIVNSTRYFWNNFCRSFYGMKIDCNFDVDNKISRGGKRNQSKVYTPQQEFFQQLSNLKSATKNILDVFMETFPVRNNSISAGISLSLTSDDSGSNYDLLNASISSLLGEIGGIVALTHKNVDKILENDHGGDNNCAVQLESVQKIFGYVLPRLSESHFGMENDDSNNMDIDMDASCRIDIQRTTNITLLKVVSQLLLPMRGSMNYEDSMYEEDESLGYYLLNRKNRFALLKHFGEAFFPKRLSTNKCTIESKNAESNREINLSSFISLSRSTVGRKALQLTVRLFMESMQERIYLRHMVGDHKLPSMFDNYWMELIRMIHFFPTYLEALGAECPQVSSNMIHCLIEILRYFRPECERNMSGKKNILSVDQDDENFFQYDSHAVLELVKNLRKETPKIFATIKIRTQVNGKAKSIKHSIFEQYPDHVQRLALGLVGVLSVPSKSLLTSLSQICSRCSSTHGISDSMAEFVYEVMHRIRKNSNIKDYLGFLMNSIGFENPPKSKRILAPSETDETSKKKDNEESVQMPVLNEKTFLYDRAISRVAREIINCGGYRKILPMLSQILKSWLSYDSYEAEMMNYYAPKARAALAIIAACSLELLNSLSSGHNNKDDIKEPFEGIWDECASTICEVFMSSSWEHDDMNIAIKKNLSPVLVLLQCHSLFGEQLLTKMSEHLCRQSDSGKNLQKTENIISSFLYLLKSWPLLKENSALSKNLIELSIDVESQLKEGPLDRLGGKLKIEVDMTVGKLIQNET